MWVLGIRTSCLYRKQLPTKHLPSPVLSFSTHFLLLVCILPVTLPLTTQGLTVCMLLFWLGRVGFLLFDESVAQR